MVFELDVVVPGLELTKDRGAPCGEKVDHTRRGDLHKEGACRNWPPPSKSAPIDFGLAFGGSTIGSTIAFHADGSSIVVIQRSGYKAGYRVPTKCRLWPVGAGSLLWSVCQGDSPDQSVARNDGTGA